MVCPFLQGGDPTNENSESTTGDGDTKDSSGGAETGHKRVNGTVDPEV